MKTMKTLASLSQLLPTFSSRGSLWHVIERNFSISSPKLARNITKTVKSFGKLFIDVPWNVEVRPTDPHDCPDMNKLIVKISSSVSSDELKMEKCLIIDVDDERACRITAKIDEKFDFFSDARFVVEAPVQYDVDARASGDSDVSIFSMVSDLINAETERGNITGAKLQAKKIKFKSSQGGSIDLIKSLQGDIEIETLNNGSIKAEKCLGTSLKMTTENGNVSLGSNYCERAIFTTVNGNLDLNNLHMDANVFINGKGSLNISCLDGSLQAKLGDGDTKIHVVRLTGKTQIITEGSVNLIVPRENNIRLSLRCNKLSLDESLRGTRAALGEEQVFETSGEIPLNVETRGNVRVTGSSWAESLQLGKFVK